MMTAQEMITHTPHPFADIPLPDFVDIILCDDDKSDEAMYYLLHHRLTHQLRERYAICHQQLLDAFEDLVEDFFLYLREGNDGKNRQPYQSLRNIKNKESFETWLLNTFRNYLTNRAAAEVKVSTFRYHDKPTDESGISLLTDEQKLVVASQLIAYAHQVFFPRGRFIFLRSLLTMLNKQQALPDKEMATALQMTYLSYRVTTHRMKQNLSKFRCRLAQGEQLRLDEPHQQMARSIYDDFTHLYPTLFTYYTQTIDTLKCADTIQQLRQAYYKATGIMAHEPNDSCRIITTPASFWEKLNRMLIY